MPDPVHLTALIYTYVEEMQTRREPYRAEHLGLVDSWTADGKLVMAGALGDPPSGAFFAFAVESEADVADFTNADPYVAAGLVTETRVEPYTVVSHRPITGETGAL